MKSFTSFLVVLILPSLLWAQGVRIKVISVHDGDTLTAVGVENSTRYKVRLMGVDTPEMDFMKASQGDVAIAARDYLRSLIPEDGVVILGDDSETDKHGRILGHIVTTDLDINLEMLKQGWGVLYFIYPFKKRLVSDFSEASREAFENHRGLFSEQYIGTEAPYDFRMRAQNLTGRNWVGDLESKKVVSQEEIASIPIWKRVFFPSLETARQYGYSLPIN